MLFFIFSKAIKSTLFYNYLLIDVSSDTFLILIFEVTNLKIKFMLKILTLNDHFSI